MITPSSRFFKNTNTPTTPPVVVLALLYALFSVLLPELYASVVQLVGNAQRYYYTVYDWVIHLLENNPEFAAKASEVINEYYTEAQHADDQGVQQLPADEAGEDAVRGLDAPDEQRRLALPSSSSTAISWGPGSWATARASPGSGSWWPSW